MADNRLSKSLEEAFINNDTQYNFGGWAPQVLFPSPVYLIQTININNGETKTFFSRNGFDYLLVDNPSKTITIFNEIDNVIYAGGDEPNLSLMSFSNNGKDWELIPSLSNLCGRWMNMLYFKGQYFALGQGGGSYDEIVAYSNDGYNFTGDTTAYSAFTGGIRAFFNAVNTNNKIFASANQNPVLQVSTDGINYSGVPYFFTFSAVCINTIVYENNQLICSVADKLVWSNDDGDTWTTTTITGTTTNVVYDGSRFVIGAYLSGNSGTRIYTANTLSSITYVGLIPESCQSLGYDGTKYFGSGGFLNNNMFYSNDLINWNYLTPTGIDLSVDRVYYFSSNTPFYTKIP